MSYNTEFDMWTAMNLHMSFDNIETIEIRDEVKRYMIKDDIRIGDAAFKNLIDKISERRIPPEINDAILLLVKFGTVKNEAMLQEQNVYKRKAMMKTILPFLKQAIELNKFFGENPHIILTQVIDAVATYEKQLAE